MDSENFKDSVNGLAREFRDKHGLPPVHQLGLVVPDVEAAAPELETMGIGPFLMLSGSPIIWVERGEQRSFAGKLGMAFHQGFELELLEPGQGSDHYRDDLDPQGRIVLQHLGLLVKDVDQWSEKLVYAGCPLKIRGRLKAGPLSVDFAYMDTANDAGFIIEFICMKLFGRVMQPNPGLIHTLGRIQKWTGKRSISV